MTQPSGWFASCSCGLSPARSRELDSVLIRLCTPEDALEEEKRNPLGHMSFDSAEVNIKVWCDQTNRITLPVAVCARKWQQHRVCSLKEFLEHQIPVVRVGLELETASWTKAQSVRWAASLNDTHNIHQKHLFVFMLMTGCFSLFVTGSPLYLQNIWWF